MEGLKRVCLLTGASGLLGSAFIERQVDNYQIVAVHDQNPIWFPTQDQEWVDPLAPLHRTCAITRRVYSMKADLSRPAEIDRLVTEVISRFGGVDLVVNGAAVYAWSHLAGAHALNDADKVVGVNIMAPLRISVRVAQLFWRSNPDDNIRANRNIVNVSSTSGSLVHPDLGLGLYGMTKAALNHLTYYMASDFWDIGVRVNALAPTTFPAAIPTETVVEAILRLDESTETGQIVPLHDRCSGASKHDGATRPTSI